MTSTPTSLSRRAALAAAAGTTLMLAGCARQADGEGGVSATEDLMREHGVLRRILVVYRESAPVLRSGGLIDAGALGQAADLFRTFGEEYHERKLEEQRVFPIVQKAGGEAGAMVSVLKAQHDRGREITAFIQSACAGGKVATSVAVPLAQALETFARMYEVHTAYEDTIVFQAWKKTMSQKQLQETGEEFEEIERQQFKGDGFDMAVDKIAEIEGRLGLHDLARYTAPAPARS